MRKVSKMPIKKQKGSSKKTGKCLLSIAGDMTISVISQNHTELMKFYTEFSSFDINLSAVEDIDCSGIQLLLALKLSAQNEGKQLILNTPSPAVSEAMDVLNIGGQFNWAVTE